MKLLEVLETGRVLRYHSAPIQRKQRLDSHQWEVAIILQHIYPECNKDLVFKALTHDCAEVFTGDIPYPVKAKSSKIKEALKILELECEIELELEYILFSNEELLALKHADVLSGMWYTRQQIRAGDRDAYFIARRWFSYYQQLAPLNHISRRLVGEIENYECKQ